MVGEDAVSVYTQLLMKFIDLIAKIGEEHRRNKQLKGPKKPKIRQGSLSKADFRRLMKKGAEFSFIQIPKDKEAEIEETIKSLNGSFFKASDPESNNSLFAVPVSQVDLVNTAVKQCLSKVLRDEPETVSVKDGMGRIAPEDMPLVSEIMQGYDIPIFSFKGSDGKYTNIVPTEYEGQYERAMNRVKELKELGKDIELFTFEQTGRLDKPDFFTKTISHNDETDIYATVRDKGLNVRFVEHDDDIVILYPAWQKDMVEKTFDECMKSTDEAAMFDISVNDNSISIDKETLLISEDEKEYFVRIPNTHGKDYLKLDKANVEEINGGKTLTAKLDPAGRYPVYDARGIFVAERDGRDLLQRYDVKHRGINKDTKVVEYGDRVDKIELFCKEKNMLVSVGIDSSDRIRSELMEQGISRSGADKLLGRINDILSSNDDMEGYRSIFNYTVEKSQIIHADVPNIGDYLAMSHLSEMVIGKADCVGYIPESNGKRCCVFDRANNKYSVIPYDRGEIMDRLTQMGYSERLAQRLADRAIKGADPQDVEEPPIQYFNSNNSELEELAYITNDDTTIMIHDTGDDVKYMSIDKGSAMSDIEYALYNGFGIRDKQSAALIMKELAGSGIIDELPKQSIGEFEITKLSSEMIEVVNKGAITPEPVMMPMDNIGHMKLESIGADEHTIAAIKKSLQKSAEEFGKPDTLTNLKKYAEKAVITIGDTAEKVGQTIGKVLPKGEISSQGEGR
ncbi:MAG: hypothetical protein IKH75_08050 [Ruminococcus sp.]|nr:hypothetical protein [Ruminococcus sp.]